MGSQRKEFRCDPTATTDAGGSPDPPLLTHHDSNLPARSHRVRPALRHATGPARRRAHSAVPVVSDQGEESGAAHLRPSGLRTALLLYPYAESANLDGTHSISPAGKETAVDPEPQGRQKTVAGSG